MRIVLALALVMAACSAAEVPEADDDAADLASQRLGWQQMRVFDYTWTYTAGTYWDHRGEVTVTVTGGQVVAVEHEDPGPRPVAVLTAPDVFRLAGEALGGDGWDVTFDTETCLPRRMSFDERTDVADDEYTFTLIDFNLSAGIRPVSCEPVAVAAHCPDLTGTGFVADEEIPAEAGGTHRPSLRFTARDVVEYNGSDYIQEIPVRCESGSLIQVEQWARLSFEDDLVVIERGRDRLRGSSPTAESACAALVGGYSATSDDQFIIELEATPERITYRLDDGSIHTIAHECLGEIVYRLYERGWHLADGRVLFDGDFFGVQTG